MEQDFLPMEIERIVGPTGNLYKSVTIISRRANQITLEIKDELSKKLAEFAPAHDNLEEVTENREQIEISKMYEGKPKPIQDAVREFLRGGVYYRNPHNPADTNAGEN
jgi:DNA-directed RNA polymerase subunit K/omega